METRFLDFATTPNTVIQFEDVGKAERYSDYIRITRKDGTRHLLWRARPEIDESYQYDNYISWLDVFNRRLK